MANIKKYPFDELGVGQSFDVPLTSVKELSLRAYASQAGKKLNKRFRVKVYRKEGVLEVTRLSNEFSQMPQIKPPRT